MGGGRLERAKGEGLPWDVMNCKVLVRGGDHKAPHVYAGPCMKPFVVEPPTLNHSPLASSGTKLGSSSCFPGLGCLGDPTLKNKNLKIL